MLTAEQTTQREQFENLHTKYILCKYLKYIYMYIVNKFWDLNYAYYRTNYAKRTIREFTYKIYLMQISEIKPAFSLPLPFQTERPHTSVSAAIAWNRTQVHFVTVRSLSFFFFLCYSFTCSDIPPNGFRNTSE